MPSKCTVCGNKTEFICSGCKTASYCCSECQATHWKSTHKRICSTIEPLAEKRKLDDKEGGDDDGASAKAARMQEEEEEVQVVPVNENRTELDRAFGTFTTLLDMVKVVTAQGKLCQNCAVSADFVIDAYLDSVGETRKDTVAYQSVHADEYFNDDRELWISEDGIEKLLQSAQEDGNRHVHFLRFKHQDSANSLLVDETGNSSTTEHNMILLQKGSSLRLLQSVDGFYTLQQWMERQYRAGEIDQGGDDTPYASIFSVDSEEARAFVESFVSTARDGEAANASILGLSEEQVDAEYSQGIVEAIEIQSFRIKDDE